MILRLFRLLLGCQRGAAAVEFSIISVVLVTLCIGIVDFGRTLYVKNQISHLADQAARRVLMDSDIASATLESDLRGGFSAGNAADLNVSIASQTIGLDTFRVITISYPVTLFVPFLDSNAISLDVTRRVLAN